MNVTGLRLRDGKSLAFSYDALGRQTGKGRPLDAPGETNVAYIYDNLGRLTQANDSKGQALT